MPVKIIYSAESIKLLLAANLPPNFFTSPNFMLGVSLITNRGINYYLERV